ncbi:hypothetical protein J4G33_14530 [Actinotalea sp. BY-33]|uniref:Uncharacterized protein n=1 Tax=Actinotalea soli TaxID=2819234 RepID=A0A939RXA4_9CELL|nr:hypothetical protein [Actinotalea soli]MBO1753026.1 hypothetical protein [Actinotalea soli]
MEHSMRSPEYDAFGPWVYEVTSPDEVPPLFRDHPLDLASARLVLKVPRRIARRDANPAMNLYDHLLVVDATGLTVLSRRGETHSTRHVPPEQVAAVVDSVNLLDARLAVHLTTRDGAGVAGAGRPAGQNPVVAVRYNGASHDVVLGLVDQVRGLYRSGPVGSPRVEDEPTASASAHGSSRHQGLALDLADLGDQDVALVTAYRDLARREGVELLAAHPRTVVRPLGSGAGGAAAGLAHAAWPMTLHGAVVCRSEDELQLVHRREWWLRGRRPVHSIERTVLPLARVDEVTTGAHPRYADVTVVSVRLGETSLVLPVPAASRAATQLPEALRGRAA